MQGYAMTLLVIYEEAKAVGEEDTCGVPPYIVRQFTKSNYYYMWPFKSAVEKELQAALEKVMDGRIDKEYPLASQVRSIIQEGFKNDA